MSSILFVLLLTLVLYSALGMVFYGSYAPPFLAVAILCLFFALKKIWTDQHAAYDLLKKELDELKAKLPSDDTEETDGTDRTDNTEETEEATETEEPDETKRIKQKLRRLAFAFVGADFFVCQFLTLSVLSVSFLSTIKPIIRIIGKIQPNARPFLSAAPSLKVGFALLNAELI